jgi:hypothetical protein
LVDKERMDQGPETELNLRKREVARAVAESWAVSWRNDNA